MTAAGNGHQQPRPLAADLDAAMQRVRDLELFTSADFWDEIAAVAADIIETADRAARHSGDLADELRIVAADMKAWGGEDDHWDRDDFKDAAIKDIEAVRAWL